MIRIEALVTAKGAKMQEKISFHFSLLIRYSSSTYLHDDVAEMNMKWVKLLLGRDRSEKSFQRRGKGEKTQYQKANIIRKNSPL